MQALLATQPFTRALPHTMLVRLLSIIAAAVAIVSCASSSPYTSAPPSTYSFTLDTIFADEPIVTRTTVAGHARAHSCASCPA
jgi:hypothetical protein